MTDQCPFNLVILLIHRQNSVWCLGRARQAAHTEALQCIVCNCNSSSAVLRAGLLTPWLHYRYMVNERYAVVQNREQGGNIERPGACPHHIITSSHHHIIISSHHHIITSSHHHIITSSHHHISFDVQRNILHCIMLRL